MGGGQTTELFTQHLTQHLEVRARSGLGTKGLELGLALSILLGWPCNQGFGTLFANLNKILPLCFWA